MLLALLVTNIALVAADPFHKYPYVFLLDVGNEEIEGTSTEQIRVTIPGGSLALKYPAVDTGDTISHVRVSGVDFGTDLKADIADGGPGYNYVVLLFMGNPGVAYDAVVTIETVSNQGVDNPDIDETNDSAEDTNDYVTKDEPVELDPASSNVYINDAGTKNDYQAEDNDYQAGEAPADDGNDGNENENEYADESEKQKYLERQRYEKYQSFRPQLYGGARIYPQASLYVEDNNFKPLYDPENHADDSSSNIYLDSNNNVNPQANEVTAD